MHIEYDDAMGLWCVVSDSDDRVLIYVDSEDKAIEFVNSFYGE